MARQSESPKWIQQAGLLTSIPMVLLVGPAIGYYLGVFLQRSLIPDPYGITLGLILGIGASIRLTVKLIRQANRLEEDDRQE